MNNIEKLHIGNIICEQLVKDGRKKVWLAKQIHCTESCLCKILKNAHIRTDMLLRISQACNHNFAQYLNDYCENIINTEQKVSKNSIFLAKNSIKICGLS